MQVAGVLPGRGDSRSKGPGAGRSSVVRRHWECTVCPILEAKELRPREGHRVAGVQILLWL